MTDGGDYGDSDNDAGPLPAAQQPPAQAPPPPAQQQQQQASPPPPAPQFVDDYYDCTLFYLACIQYIVSLPHRVGPGTDSLLRTLVY